MTARLAKNQEEVEEIMEISPEKAIEEYVTELGTFGAEDIVWKE